MAPPHPGLRAFGLACAWLAAAAEAAAEAAPQAQRGSGYVCDVVPEGVERQRGSPESWPLCGPQLIVAGVQKGGTTSVYEYLKAHPDFVALDGTYLLPRRERATVVKALSLIAPRMTLPPRPGDDADGPDPRTDMERWLRLANVTREEVEAAQPSEELKQFSLRNFQEVESHAIAVRLGKEVRFWINVVPRLLKNLGVSRERGLGFYLDLFPRVPAPPELLWARGLPLPGGLSEVPERLRRNLWKVTGEASPHYLAQSHAPHGIHHSLPGAKVLFLMRSPVERYWSQALMVEKMSPPGDPSQPYAEDFERNVLRCIGGDEPEGRVHPSARLQFIPGGGGLVRMRQLVWGPEGATDAAKWQELRRDLDRCFTHGLGQFLHLGIYVTDLAVWLRAGKYPRKQMLLLPSEDLYAAPEKTMDRISTFAGLRTMGPEFWSNATQVLHNPHFDTTKLEFSHNVEVVGAKKEQKKMGARARELLRAFYAGPNCGLRSLIQEDWSDSGWVYCDGDVGGGGGGGSGGGAAAVAVDAASAAAASAAAAAVEPAAAAAGSGASGAAVDDMCPLPPRCAAHKPADRVALASHPRAGSTWLRYLMERASGLPTGCEKRGWANVLDHVCGEADLDAPNMEGLITKTHSACYGCWRGSDLRHRMTLANTTYSEEAFLRLAKAKLGPHGAERLQSLGSCLVAPPSTLQATVKMWESGVRGMEGGPSEACDFQYDRAVFLVRDPLDAFRSNYHYRKNVLRISLGCTDKAQLTSGSALRRWRSEVL